MTIATASFAVDGFGPPYSPDPAARFDSGRDARPIGASNGGAAWMLVWNSEDPRHGYGPDGDVFYTRSMDYGYSWSEVRALNNNAATDSGHDGGPLNGPWIATDRNGVWICVWESMDSLNGTIGTDNDILFARSLDDGATWSDPMPLNINAAADQGEDIAPMIEMSGDGTWITVWSSTDSLGGTIGGDTDILFSRSQDNGMTWSAPAPINTYAPIDGDAPDRDPSIKSDGAGGWISTWSSAYALTPQIDDDEDIFYSQSADDGLTWSPAAPLNQNAWSDGDGRDHRPSIDGDKRGNWVCVWHSNTNLAENDGYDQDIFMARSDNNATTWTWPALIDPAATEDGLSDFVPTIRTDGAGRWYVVYESNNPLIYAGYDYDILLTRSLDNGLSWSPPQFLNRSAFSDSGSDFSPQMIPGGDGRWLGVWWSFDPMGEFGPDADVFYSMRQGELNPYNAYVLNVSFPSRMVVNQSAAARIRMLNTGSVYWSEYVVVRLLATLDSCGMHANPRFSIPGGAKIQPGAWVDFNVTLQAPAEPGVCDLTYQMIEELGPTFGAEARVTIPVAERGGDDAAVAGSSAPQALDAAESGTLRVDFKNIGLNTWNTGSGYSVALTADTCGLAASPGSAINTESNIIPDELILFEQPLLAPDVHRVCSLRFQMSHDGVLFGDPFDVGVKVNGNAAKEWANYE